MTFPHCTSISPMPRRYQSGRGFRRQKTIDPSPDCARRATPNARSFDNATVDLDRRVTPRSKFARGSASDRRVRKATLRRRYIGDPWSTITAEYSSGSSLVCRLWFTRRREVSVPAHHALTPSSNVPKRTTPSRLRVRHPQSCREAVGKGCSLGDMCCVKTRLIRNGF